MFSGLYQTSLGLLPEGAAHRIRHTFAMMHRFLVRPHHEQNVKLLYGAHRIGDYSYGAKRHRHDFVLNEALSALPRDAKIYDIGCGTGAYLRYFRSLGFERMTGVDLAPENIEPLLAEGFCAFEGNVLDLSNVPSGSADFTFSQGVIHHTPDPPKAFAELVRITKAGAALYVNVYNAWNP
jgi:SAM-dependent methyltransferase